MKIQTLILVLFMCLGLVSVGLAQNTVSGTVTDASTGEPIPGVNILVKGTTIGAFTNADGAFSVQPKSLQDTLVVSFVGYKTEIVPIDGRTEINIRLAPSAIVGQELVVVGYGTQKKETLTGSISTVSGEKLETAPVTNMTNALAGRLPGVMAITASGEPGYSGSTIRIRGAHTLNNNAPLVIIDGVPSETGLGGLNPNSIESMTVLKDATAAIYGSRAANGVILVTTKRGHVGEPQFTINFNQGFNQPTRIPEMADAATYMRMLNEIDMYRGNQKRFSEEEIQCHASGNKPWLCPSTDWFAEALKPMSFQTKGSMSVSGGSEDMQYRLSIGGLTEDGYYENSATRYNQYHFRSNVDAQISESISVRFDVYGRFEDRNFPTISAANTFRMLMRGKPHKAAYWPNGLPATGIEYGQNPVVTGTPVTGYNNDERYFLQTDLKIKIEIPGVEGLSVTGMAAYSKNFQRVKRWETPWTLYSFNREAFQQNGGDPAQYLTGDEKGPTEPQLYQLSGDSTNILLNLVVEYEVDLEDHSIGILLGTERQTFTDSYFNAFRRYYISDKIDQLFAGGELERSNDGSAKEGGRLNFFGRFNYAYQDKYLFEFVARYDGSYIFPKGQRFGFFPAFSVGWRLSEEEFFQNNFGFFDEFKLRASWGQTGNDRVDPWQFMPSYGFGSGYVFGVDQEVTSLYPSRTPNPEITWEVATQFDVGIDAVMFDNRLAITIDYWDYLRTDILTYRNASIPLTTGLTLPLENIGEVRSHGVDGSITWRDNIGKDFFYNITLNGGYATNEIKFWDEPPGAPAWQRSTGKKMNTNLYYKAIGVFKTQEDVENYPHWDNARPGDIIFKDVNGDGEITADDRVRINKSNIPEWTGGIIFSGGYKQFDFTVMFQGAAGAVQYLATQSGTYGNYLAAYAKGRWRPEDPSATKPRAYNRSDEYWSPLGNLNTYFLRNTDYVRLKTVEIGYSLSPDLTTKLGLKNMRVYVSGFNLYTWDSFDVMDPEASESGGLFYPQKRVFNLGISVTF